MDYLYSMFFEIKNVDRQYLNKNKLIDKASKMSLGQCIQNSIKQVILLLPTLIINFLYLCIFLTLFYVAVNVFHLNIFT